MKLNKQTVIRALCVHTLICSVLSVLFSQKKKTLSAVFAGLSIAGAIANIAVVFSDKLCACRRHLPEADLCDDIDEKECDDDEGIDEEDIYCDFEVSSDSDGENTADAE